MLHFDVLDGQKVPFRYRFVSIISCNALTRRSSTVNFHFSPSVEIIWHALNIFKLFSSSPRHQQRLESVLQCNCIVFRIYFPLALTWRFVASLPELFSLASLHRRRLSTLQLSDWRLSSRALKRGRRIVEKRKRRPWPRSALNFFLSVPCSLSTSKAFPFT